MFFGKGLNPLIFLHLSMEDKKKEIALLLRARNAFLRVYNKKEFQKILSIEQDVKFKIEELRKEMDLKTRYKYFFEALKRVKVISKSRDILVEKGKEKTPIYKHLDHKCFPETLKFMENALLLFTLKEGTYFKELYLNPEIEEYQYDIRNLPTPPIATTLLSLSDKLFKTAASALMTLESEIRPKSRVMAGHLYHAKKSEDIEDYIFDDPKGFHRGVYRLTSKGGYRRRNVLSFAKICGLLERDLVNIDTPLDEFRGYRVLDWNKSHGFHFNGELSKKLIYEGLRESKILPKPREKGEDEIKWFNYTVKKLNIKPETPLILTEEGEKFLERYGNDLVDDQKVFTRRISASSMRSLIPILYLIRDYGFLSASECYENFNTFYCKPNHHGFPGVISEMLEKDLIIYASFNRFSDLIH